MSTAQTRNIQNLPDEDYMALLFMLVEHGYLDLAGNVTPLGEEYVADETNFSFERTITNKWVTTAPTQTFDIPLTPALEFQPGQRDGSLKITIAESADEATVRTLEAICKSLAEDLAPKGIALQWTVVQATIDEDQS